LTSEQLQSARAERWRQASNPVLTAEDAQAWLEEIGLCLFLPRRTHFAVPAPSFVEAMAGASTEAPSREAIENAASLLHRLTADGVVVPLNLFNAGAFGAGSGGVVAGVDQPDFLVTRETLAYVFSLIGGRNWKSGPGAKASPLVLEVWKHLEGAGAQTAQEIQTALGREVTEGAVLRALVELWHGLRAIPVYDGETTRWELTQARFAAEMTASQKVAQTTALSVLVALYADAVVAASSEEIETFLSPLSARSRVREVVNGLSATRQLGLVSVGAQPLFHVVGSLPEFAEAEPVKPEVATHEPHDGARPRTFEKRPGFERRPPFEKRGEGFGERSGRRPFERGPRQERPASKPFERRAAGGAGPERRDRAGAERPYRKSFEKERGAEGRERSPQDRERRPFAKKPFDGGRRPFAKKPFDGERRPFAKKPFDKTSSPPGEGRSGGAGKFPPKRFGTGGERKPWQDRGERPRFEKSGEEAFRPRRAEGREGERGGERPAGKFGVGKFGAGKKFAGPKRFGERGASSASRGPGPASHGPSSSSPGDRERPGGKRPFFRERGAEGESRQGSDARSGPRAGGWKPKQGKPEFRRAGERGGAARPGERAEGRAPFRSGDKPGFGKKKFGERGPGKPGFKSAKPFGKPGKSFGKKPFGKSPFGKPKPGGFKPPFRKRKKDEGGTSE
jgi:23S rRNA pseudouridine2605 synthase